VTRRALSSSPWAAGLKAWDKTKRTAVLVTDADTLLGDAVVMQLIVAKVPVTAMGLSPAGPNSCSRFSATVLFAHRLMVYPNE